MARANMNERDNPFSETARFVRQSSSGNGLGAVALIAALLALVVAIGAFWESRDTARDLQQMLGVKLGEQSAVVRESAARTELLTKDLRDAQNRLAQLEGKLAEFQGQRVALEEMYRELRSEEHTSELQSHSDL